jgi:hypothetical protein
MDRAQIYTVDSLLPKDDNQADDQPGEILKAFRSFVLEFRLDNNFIYRYVHLSQSSYLFSAQLKFWCSAMSEIVFVYHTLTRAIAETHCEQTSSSNYTCLMSTLPI